MSSIYQPLEHFVYPVLDIECCCFLCTNWREQRGRFDFYKMLTLDHNRSCMCWRCQHRRILQQGFFAAASKRELYCEMSYHASLKAHSYGMQLMSWTTSVIEQSREPNGWWSTISQALTLTYWLARFQSETRISGVEGANGQHTIPTSGWCSWCGNDLPPHRVQYCSEQCTDDAAADERTKWKAFFAPPQRLRLTSSVVVSGSFSGRFRLSNPAARLRLPSNWLQQAAASGATA